MDALLLHRIGLHDLTAGSTRGDVAIEGADHGNGHALVQLVASRIESAEDFVDEGIKQIRGGENGETDKKPFDIRAGEGINNGDPFVSP